MVSSISGTTSYQQYTPQVNSNYSLSDDQKETINSILSNYDSENMTKENFDSLFDELKSSGIQMCDDLKEILETSGFQPSEGPQGPPPTDDNSSTDQTSNSLTEDMIDILEKIKSGDISSDDIDSLIKNLQESGQLTQGNLVNKTA
jgi:hypothetical protein